MDRFGHNIRADVRKQGAEVSDLPILCETCLGENPYVRLIREENGKECKICQNPFTHFRWKPGQRGRYKQTIICNGCAKLKNVCQTCLFDLDYNLPVQVRDKFLDSAITLPENEVNRTFYLEQAGKNLEISSNYDKINRPSIDLTKLRRYDPYFKRNMARVCSFWRKNICNRGDECPYLHKEIHLDKTLSNQNIKSRYAGENDILAEKILSKIKQQEKTCDGNYKENTICLIGAGHTISEMSMKDYFKKFGDIVKVEMRPEQLKAYITFGKTVSAKKAYNACKEGLRMSGCLIKVALESEEHMKIYKLPANETSGSYMNHMTNMFYPYHNNNGEITQQKEQSQTQSSEKIIYPSLIPSEAEQRR